MMSWLIRVKKSFKKKVNTKAGILNKNYSLINSRVCLKMPNEGQFLKIRFLLKILTLTALLNHRSLKITLQQ